MRMKKMKTRNLSEYKNKLLQDKTESEKEKEPLNEGEDPYFHDNSKPWRLQMKKNSQPDYVYEYYEEGDESSEKPKKHANNTPNIHLKNRNKNYRKGTKYLKELGAVTKAGGNYNTL